MLKAPASTPCSSSCCRCPCRSLLLSRCAAPLSAHSFLILPLQSSPLQVFQGFWGLDEVRRNRDLLFVFGDNDARTGAARSRT